MVNVTVFYSVRWCGVRESLLKIEIDVLPPGSSCLGTSVGTIYAPPRAGDWSLDTLTWSLEMPNMALVMKINNTRKHRIMPALD